MKKAPAKRMLAFFIACLMVVTTCLTVSINASDYVIVEWDYLDQGTGMPDPNDPSEGLPFPNVEGVDPKISEYCFTYKPEVFAYGEDGVVDMTAPVTTVKAGDVFWLKIACTDIERDKLTAYEGFYDFEGFYTYDVEAIDRYYGGKVVSKNPGKAGILDTTWFKKFINIEKLEGMADFEIEMNWAILYTPSAPPADYLDASVNGMGQHFSLMVKGVEYGDFGIIEDGQFYFCVPLVIKADAEDGEEYTFTVPYPGLEQFADAYYWNDEDGYLYHDSVYGRGGAYKITVDNHDDVNANLATGATYAIAVGFDEVYGDSISDGYINDLLYPLTEKSKYTVIDMGNDGYAAIDITLAELSDVDSVVVTFNDTADANLPSAIEVYGVDAFGNEYFLGEASTGTPYYAGVTDSTNYASTVNINAANAYQYKITGIEDGKYTDIVVRISGEGSVAVGEVEILGEAAKVSVTIENGTIEDASSDNLYYPGDVITIIPDDIDHKTFVEWATQNNTGEFAKDGDVWTFTVGSSDEVITAIYEDVYYSIDIINGVLDNGETTDEVLYGTELGITEEMAPGTQGKVFDRWVVSGDAVVADPEAPETTVTVYGDATVTATYKDVCTLAVTNGSGSGEYLPGETADISADNAEEGYVFYKWEVVSGDVDISDVKSAETTAVVNSNAEIKAVYVWAYKDVPENLVNEDTEVKLVQGAALSGSSDFTNDQLYPLLPDGNWLIATDNGSVVLSYDLGSAYDISDVVVNVSKLDGYVYTDEIVIYGANSADLSDKTELARKAVSDVDSVLSFDDGVELTANSALINVDVDDTFGYRYVVVELSSDYYFNYPGLGVFQNGNLAIGEVEIYGDLARYDITVEGADVEYNGNDDITDGYLSGSELILTPVVPEGKEFERWETTVGEVVTENNENKYYVDGDATITAVYTDINQPVPDNLAPGSTVELVAGSLISDDATSAYINDQLYPMTAGAYWASYVGDNNEQIKFIFDLGDYYDISSGSVTVHTGDFPAQILMQEGVKFEGSNNADGSDAVLIGQIASGCLEPETYTALDFADFGVDSSLTSVACKYDILAENDVSCRYVVVTLSTKYADVIASYYPNPTLKLGEVEIYGTESKFKVTIEENGTITDPSDDDLYNDGTEITITAADVPHKDFVGWEVEGEGSFADSTSSTTTFVVGGTDAVISAVYEDVLYNLVVENGTGSGQYVYGSTIEISANSPIDPEKVFDKWIVTGDATVEDATNPVTNVTTGTDSTITATYKDRVYLLTVENGTGSDTYPNGATANITANEPAAHKAFSHWEVVTGSCQIADPTSESTTVITTNVPTTVRAVYVDILYDVTVNNGTIADDDISEDGYKVGTVIDITADEPEEHKQFAGWNVVSGDCTISDKDSASATLTVLGGDVVVEATYTDIQYTLTVNGGEGSGSFIYGQEGTITATAPGDMYIFDGWTIVEGADNVVIADDAAESTTITVNGDATVQSNWIKVYDVDVINGAVSEESLKDHYLEGDVVTIIADELEDGMQFDGWVIVEGEGVIEDANALTTTVTVGTTDLVVRAEFSKIMVDLTVTNGDGSGSYEIGSEITITANVPDGYIFTGWEVTEGDAIVEDANAAETTITVNSDATVVASFIKAYTIDVVNGAVSEDDVKDYYLEGETVTVIADDAEDGMQFVGWVIVEGEGVIEDASAPTTTITVGTTDLVIRAEYESVEVMYNLVVENGFGGGEYVAGTEVTITANIPDGYVFIGWTVTEGDVVVADPFATETTVVLTGNATVTANSTEAFEVDVINGVIDNEKDYYVSGDRMTINADPAPEHMRFDHWVVVEGEADIEDPNSPDTYATVNSGDVVIRAEYTDILYSVTVEKGSIDNPNEDEYKVGTSLNISADVAADGYVFDRWIIVSGSGEFGDETDANTSFTVGGGDTVIRATYKVIGDTPATGDSGIAIFAVLSIVTACAASVVVKKKTK